MRFCVYCASQPGNKPVYRQAARELGQLMAEKGIGLVYGGNKYGLMGEVATTALVAGGKVVGVMPHVLSTIEQVHPGLTELYFVETLHERKERMISLSDGAIVLPGAAGTMDEMFEHFTWLNLGLHEKTCAIFNIDGFYDPLLALMQRMVADGFLLQEHLDSLIVSSQASELLDKLCAWQPKPPVWGLRKNKLKEVA